VRQSRQLNFAGKTALITGAAGGIGAALAQGLAARGANLVLTDRDATGLKAVASGLADYPVTVHIHPFSVEDRQAVAGLPAWLTGRGISVDMLFNNAGVALGGSFSDVYLADFEWLIDINFSGMVRLTKALLPGLLQRPDAVIVNVSSIFGLVAPPGQTAYSASKFAVRGFSAALRHELADGPVAVCTVHPGGIRTGIARNARMAPGLSDTEKQAGVKAMERSFRLTADQAAEVILNGVARRKPRILVGVDAKLISILERLTPVHYWAVMRRLFVKEPKRRGEGP